MTGNGSARRALILVCAFAVAMSTNYTNHGPLLGIIAAEFHLTSADAGLIATAWFTGAAATMLFGGVLVDRFGARQIVTAGWALVLISNLASGLFVPSFPALLFWRGVGGLGSGAGFAAGASYASGIFAGRGGHLAQGLYGAALLAGSGGIIVVMPLLAGPAQDWRQAFVLSGIGVGLAFVAWLLLAPSVGNRRQGKGLAQLPSIMRERNVLILAICHTCGFGLAIVVSTWATGYLMGTFDLPLTQAGALGSLLLVTGIAARSGGGAILERGVRPILLIQASLLVTAIGLLLMAFPAGQLWIALVGLLLTGLGVGVPYAAVFNGVAASVPRGPASAQAAVGWAAVLGTLAGPPVLGALRDATGSFAAGFTALAVLALLALGTTAWLVPFTFTRNPTPSNVSAPAAAHK